MKETEPAAVFTAAGSSYVETDFRIPPIQPLLLRHQYYPQHMQHAVLVSPKFQFDLFTIRQSDPQVVVPFPSHLGDILVANSFRPGQEAAVNSLSRVQKAFLAITEKGDIFYRVAMISSRLTPGAYAFMALRRLPGLAFSASIGFVGVFAELTAARTRLGRPSSQNFLFFARFSSTILRF